MALLNVYSEHIHSRTDLCISRLLSCCYRQGLHHSSRGQRRQRFFVLVACSILVSIFASGFSNLQGVCVDCCCGLLLQVNKAKETEAATKQKDAYIRKLESRLLTQHKAPAASKTKSNSENSKAGSGTEHVSRCHNIDSLHGPSD